uniref:Secreted protein n=1 Tax=Globodera pallida TaxID=36090 RepID=A0A183BJH2_GLOPA
MCHCFCAILSMLIVAVAVVAHSFPLNVTFESNDTSLIDDTLWTRRRAADALRRHNANHRNQNRHNGEQQHNEIDRDQEKLQLIEHQEETGQQAPVDRPLSLQRSFQLPVEKVESPTTAEETFLGQMREKKKVADLIACFNAGVFVPDENGPTKKISGTGAGKVDELC